MALNKQVMFNLKPIPSSRNDCVTWVTYDVRLLEATFSVIRDGENKFNTYEAQPFTTTHLWIWTKCVTLVTSDALNIQCALLAFSMRKYCGSRDT